MRIRQDYWKLGCLWAAVIFLVALCMFPPWRNTWGFIRHAPLWRGIPIPYPLRSLIAVDYPHLLLELVSGEAVIGALFLSFRKK